MRYNNKKKYIIFSLVFVLFLMIAGFAAYNQRLTVNETSKIDANFNIAITNVETVKTNGKAVNNTEPFYSGLEADFDVNFTDKGDYIEYEVTVSNKGSIDAYLNNIVVNNENPNVVEMSYRDISAGDLLAMGQSKVFIVKIMYKGGTGSGEINITLGYGQENNPEEIVIPEISNQVVYDTKTNGGVENAVKSKVYKENENVDLSIKAHRNGYEFIGWNTNKDSKEALKELKMGNEDITLYAIYKKEVTLTYVVPENTDLNKTNDKCILYNNETSCQIEMPEVSKTGYIFDGWYEDKNYTNKISNNYNISENKVAYANFIEDVVTLTVSSLSTSNEITVTANTTSVGKITKYEYSIDNGETWVSSESNTHTFTGLTQNTEYNVKVRVTSESGKEVTSETETITTKTLGIPTFTEVETTTGKKVTVTYPEECNGTYTCSYIKDGEETTVTEKTVEVEFTTSGNIIAKITDGTNETSSVYEVRMPAVMQSWTSSATTDFHNSTYKEKIKSVDILDTKAVPETAVDSWDVSEKKDESVMAYVMNDPDNEGFYKLYIGGDGGVDANSDSSRIFWNFKGLQTANLALFITENVKIMDLMFDGCNNLTELDLSNFNTSNVTSLRQIVDNCSKLSTLDISSFDTSNVWDMTSMFYGCSNLTNLDVSHFDTSEVRNMTSIFSNCSGLTNLDVSNFDTGKVTMMYGLFAGCSGLTNLDISNFDTSNVMDMRNIFSSCSSLTSLDISSFDTSNVTNMTQMFFNCSGLTSLDVSNFNTSNVQNMSLMFQGCSNLIELNLNNFNTEQVKNMQQMFQSCNKLTNLNLSSFNTNQVTNMSYMFKFCSSLTSLNISNFDTSNVTDMGNMFSSCTGLIDLDLSNFNTSNVTNMDGMFYSCSSLTSLDISSFDTGNVTIMGGTYAESGMFKWATKLTIIYVGPNWVINEGTTTTNMFTGCGTDHVTLKSA